MSNNVVGSKKIKLLIFEFLTVFNTENNYSLHQNKIFNPLINRIFLALFPQVFRILTRVLSSINLEFQVINITQLRVKCKFDTFLANSLKLKAS